MMIHIPYLMAYPISVFPKMSPHLQSPWQRQPQPVRSKLTVPVAAVEVEAVFEIVPEGTEEEAADEIARGIAVEVEDEGEEEAAATVIAGALI